MNQEEDNEKNFVILYLKIYINTLKLIIEKICNFHFLKNNYYKLLLLLITFPFNIIII